MFPNLIPDPLHPAVVHLPIALVLVLPLVAIGALVAIRRGGRPVIAWGLTLAVLEPARLLAHGPSSGRGVMGLPASAPPRCRPSGA